MMFRNIMRLDLLGDMLKSAKENMSIGDSSSEISGVAGYVRIKQSGVEVDPCFWIGRFSKPKRQGAKK